MKQALDEHTAAVVVPRMKEDELMFDQAANKDRPVKVYMDEAPLITDMNELMNISFDGLNMARGTSAQCPWNKAVDAMDLKLDIFGP